MNGLINAGNLFHGSTMCIYLIVEHWILRALFRGARSKARLFHWSKVVDNQFCAKPMPWRRMYKFPRGRSWR